MNLKDLEKYFQPIIGEEDLTSTQLLSLSLLTAPELKHALARQYGLWSDRSARLSHNRARRG